MPAMSRAAPRRRTRWRGRRAGSVTGRRDSIPAPWCRMVTMADMTGWAPVTDAAGKVLGWMAPAGPDEPDVDWFEADRVPRAGRRAAALYELAALAGDEAFSAGEVADMGRR